MDFVLRLSEFTMKKQFSLYCQKWEDVLGNEIVSSYTGEQTLYEYVESPVLEDAVRLYVENAIHTVTDSKNWVSQEKRNRGMPQRHTMYLSCMR